MTAKPILRICIHALAAVLAASPGHGQTLNVLHSFAHNELGYQPASGVTVGKNGELYGTTPFGGAAGFGVAYELVPPSLQGGAWTEVVLHSFGASDGQPTAGLLLGPSGALYGVASSFDSNSDGTVFELRPPAGTATHWRERVLYAFTDSNGDGAAPQARPVFGSHGALYGTTFDGGTGLTGIVYQLVPAGAEGGAWTEQVLHDFQGKLGDGENPVGALALGSDGAVYGATESGGASDAGAVFQLTPPATSDGAWAETLLYSFEGGADSASPNGVILGPGGVLYGASFGETRGDSRACEDNNECGTVFQLSPPAAPGGAWSKTILHAFTFETGDGWLPSSTPILGPGGALYGTTGSGGASGGGLGIIFEMVPPSSAGGAWTEVILYSFPPDGAEGEEPNSLTLGQDGNLYGTTIKGGANDQGTVFQLVPQ